MTTFVPIDHPWIDSSRAPIYLLAFPASATDVELQSMCGARELWAERATYPVAWVVDLSNVSAASAMQRRIFSQHLARFEPHDIKYNCGSALVVPNAFLRGVVTATFWLRPPKFEHQCFSNRTLAMAWAKEQLSTTSDESLRSS